MTAGHENKAVMAEKNPFDLDIADLQNLDQNHKKFHLHWKFPCMHFCLICTESESVNVVNYSNSVLFFCSGYRFIGKYRDKI